MNKKKNTCNICGMIVPDGHTLCRKHWIEKQEGNQINSTRGFIDKFRGQYNYGGRKVKSKSELLLCYFFAANGLDFRYEPCLTVNGKEYRPDFVLFKGDKCVIVEHFGLDNSDYQKKRIDKEKAYQLLMEYDSNYYYIATDEDDILDLSDRVGRKLNSTPLSLSMWK